jgi:hypothetical protein
MNPGFEFGHGLESRSNQSLLTSKIKAKNQKSSKINKLRKIHDWRNGGLSTLSTRQAAPLPASADAGGVKSLSFQRLLPHFLPLSSRFIPLSAQRQQTPAPLLVNPGCARCKAHVSCCLLRPEIALG